MSAPQGGPYGSWTSPITAAEIASGAMGLGEVQLHGEDVFWLELRPAEGGRSVVVRRRPDGGVEDCIPREFNARTRVHEYGGGSYLVAEGTLCFANFADQRLYRVAPGEEPRALTPPSALRFADLVWDPHRRRIVCVREDHRGGGEPVNAIVALDPVRGGEGEVLMGGRDFFAAPRLSPDGSRLAWLAWDHASMPWDAAELWVAGLREDGTTDAPRGVAGGRDEAALQPSWSPDGILHFASDRTDWWNLYRVRGGRVEALTDLPAEVAAPPWVFGLQHYAFASARRILCAFTRHGTWSLAMLDVETRQLTPFDLPYTEIGSIRCDARQAVFLAGSPAEPLAVVRLSLESGEREVLRRSLTLGIPPEYLSAPQAVEFPTSGGRRAHGLFYPPRNPLFTAPPGEKPPLLVMVHGGPTSAASTALRLNIQYYTSRGIAVLDVNYGGSTGYGRAYRQQLYGKWGVVDVDDCCAGAAFLAAEGRVDGSRLAIRGGSAGGFTTLACLAFRTVFAAGASHYGVSDCEVLARDTHKFEARYLDTLIGPYPERRDLYLARSPLHHLEGLRRPVIFFQGLEDAVVPPSQAMLMFEALRKRGVPTAYIPFEGEQHGFRQAESIRRALEAELYFFGRILGFRPADPLQPVPIQNLP